MGLIVDDSEGLVWVDGLAATAGRGAGSMYTSSPKCVGEGWSRK